jgi:hypothetical protein
LPQARTRAKVRGVNINAEWQRAHPMPRNPSFEERVAWHREHAVQGGCRRPPPDIADRLERERENRVR